jgi:hypothetical protein
MYLIRAKWSVLLILLDLISLIVFGKAYVQGMKLLIMQSSSAFLPLRFFQVQIFSPYCVQNRVLSLRRMK